MVLDNKTLIRSQVKKLRPTNEESSSVLNLLLNWDLFQKSSKVAVFIAMKDELDLSTLLESGKELYLPRFNAETKKYEMHRWLDENSLIEGRYGIKEPAGTSPKALKNEIDLWFIPGVAFSRSGGRLGRGAGFYDRLLEQERGLKCGVCTASRIFDEIPQEEHDIKMDFVLTDKEIITVN